MKGGTSLVASSLSASSSAYSSSYVACSSVGQLVLDVRVLDPQRRRPRASPRKAVDAPSSSWVSFSRSRSKCWSCSAWVSSCTSVTSSPTRHLRAPDADALVGGVVERERAAVGHLVEGLEQVELARRHAEGPQLGRRSRSSSARSSSATAAVVIGGLLRVLGRGEEVDVHGVVEVEAALVLDEGGQVGDAGVPLVGVARAVVGRDWSVTTATSADDQEHRRRSRRAGGPATGAAVGGAGGSAGRRLHGSPRAPAPRQPARAGRRRARVRRRRRRRRRGGRLTGVTSGQRVRVRAMASSGSKSSGEVAGIGAVGRAADLQVGAQRDDRRDDVAEQERGRGAVDPVLGHEHERRHEDRESTARTVMSTVARAAVPDAGLGEVHGGDRPRDRGDHQRREDVGRRLVLLAVERDDQVARRAWRWPRRPPSGPRPRRWPGAPGCAGARRRARPRRAGPARWPSARSRRRPPRPTRRRSWRSRRRSTLTSTITGIAKVGAW